MNPELIKRLKKMQSEIDAKQKEFSNLEFSVEKQGIKITAKGDFSIQKIDIDPALIDPDDKELLEDLLIVSINELIDKINEEQNKIIPKDMPGGLPF
ncbi:hypothetical protein BCF59_0552 [Mycoplasmopsis mustelae]|uniref:Nucleoid-associated protein BCF59_0552 n=1 Tax=Mycoplasmopsis mustelae TaxID=171289 RepID=A0A4R7UC87_9BACT|nr:YbaB/EbfC family nucleoid-associated protein [Mycoplasmopsis mustelae]TDV23561.1 hypothetical protein BCF59_0552 [Mycoplasmopsis mustelae]